MRLLWLAILAVVLTALLALVTLWAGCVAAPKVDSQASVEAKLAGLDQAVRQNTDATIRGNNNRQATGSIAGSGWAVVVVVVAGFYFAGKIVAGLYGGTQRVIRRQRMRRAQRT